VNDDTIGSSVLTGPQADPVPTEARAAEAECDLLVVGGGINGAGIALDAAGRGLTTVLCEQHDLASHTSSASTKLIHGGLRYLEHYDFDLVRKALQEREVLLAAAPHIIRPLLFVLPHDSHLRPAWMIRAGLFLYDHMARRRRLPASTSVDLRRHPAGAALEGQYRRGFVYADASVDDSRLVVLNALAARERGARLLTRTRCSALVRTGDRWRATLVAVDGARQSLLARAVVNATGPWVTRFIDEVADTLTARTLRLVKGSHIVVRRLFDHSFAYIFQNPDRRIVFAIPYEDEFTLIGTTDVDYAGDPGEPAIDDDERSYLVEMANRYFDRDLSASDVLWTYSGVRPLLDDESSDAASVSRDYSLELECQSPPLLSVYGGKITTYRRVAEEAVDQLVPLLGRRARAWTRAETLPGGDMPRGDLEAFCAGLATRRPWLAGALARRYARAYGTRVEQLLAGCSAMRDLGTEVLPGLYAREIEYLRAEEWAVTAEDILFRRSKLGLHLPADATGRLDGWLAAHPAGAAWPARPE
jgi:glycerol-3-phosphate dehydrogenase